jgi:hypothetical protein
VEARRILRRHGKKDKKKKDNHNGLDGTFGSGADGEGGDGGSDDGAMSAHWDSEAADELALAAAQHCADCGADTLVRARYCHHCEAKTVGKEHPVGKVSTSTRAHEEPERHSADHAQPKRGGLTHAEVQVELLMKNHPGEFGIEVAKHMQGNSRTYRPIPYRSPGPEGKPQR